MDEKRTDTISKKWQLLKTNAKQGLTLFQFQQKTFLYSGVQRAKTQICHTPQLASSINWPPVSMSRLSFQPIEERQKQF